jgi:energy-coupling factor transporter ATP-binding protein EcfA2
MVKDKLELISYTDIELLSYLNEEWQLNNSEDIVVIGRLSARKNKDNRDYFTLFDIKSTVNDIIEYPVSGLEYRELMVNRGVFVPPSSDLKNKFALELKNNLDVIIKCHLELARPEERVKHSNPLLMQVNPSTVKLLKSFDSAEIINDEFGKILIEESIYNTIYSQKYDEIAKRIDLVRDDKEKKLNHDLSELENKISDLNTSNTRLDKQKTNLENVISTQESRQIDISNQIYSSLEEKKTLEVDLADLKTVIKVEKVNRMRNLEKFRTFVKAQADILLNLEFINESEYNKVLMIDDSDRKEMDFLGFKSDFESDFSKATSHIQAYLYEKDILYPKYILEDFFALIQTNDLIILAGESGSGKTNLVKSFAKAVGGVAKIIPVKPNWTSSEDLLGYYNPLEKKYLTTPFLDALLEASKNPEIPYFICLDEMNLARIEYYFADFLSLLEERESDVELHLYSDDESSHVLSEFKNVLEIINKTKEKFEKNNVINFVQLLQDKEINEELKRVFGFSDKDSLIKYHSDLRRMITGIINVPSSISFPKNARIIGAINIDETTHYLSPKIIDRAHIMKFDSPLLFNWTDIQNEVGSEFDVTKAIHFNIDDFGKKSNYPKFEMDNEFCQLIVELSKTLFSPLTVEVGLRTIRQGLNYKNKFEVFNPEYSIFINNFFIHKILPKLTFDGNKLVGSIEKKDLLLRLQEKFSTEIIQNKIEKNEGRDAIEEFEELIQKAKANDWIVNYWA